jgi:uncharacterized protein YjdB
VPKRLLKIERIGRIDEKVKRNVVINAGNSIFREYRLNSLTNGIAALTIQRCWRGWLVRQKFINKTESNDLSITYEKSEIFESPKLPQIRV